MAKNNSASKIALNSFEDLFGRTDSDNRNTDVRDVLIEELHDFHNHPYKIKNDKRMDELVASIKEHGVLVPGIARLDPAGGYEIIAGHSRKRACEIAGITTMPMYIRNLSDDAATIVMVDSNIQREDVLPSEKAWAYKMKYDAIKHQGKKGDSLKLMSDEAGESGKVIQRYIRLTDLIIELLDMVDSKKVGFTQGVELSFLKKKEQEWVLNQIKKNEIIISIKQASKLKKLSQNRELTETVTVEILLADTKKTKKRKVTLDSSRLDDYFPENVTEEEIKEIIISLLDNWRNKTTEGVD